MEPFSEKEERAQATRQHWLSQRYAVVNQEEFDSFCAQLDQSKLGLGEILDF
jgi:hypothetical protein